MWRTREEDNWKNTEETKQEEGEKPCEVVNDAHTDVQPLRSENHQDAMKRNAIAGEELGGMGAVRCLPLFQTLQSATVQWSCTDITRVSTT